MKKKMKLKLQILSLLLAVVLGMGIMPANVYAAENPVSRVETMNMTYGQMGTPDIIMQGNVNNSGLTRDASYLSNCNISIGYADYGLHIVCQTSTTKMATKIGVTDVKVQEKSGIFWNTIATSSGSFVYNDETFLGSCDCTNVVDGKTYRIKCTHYAYVDGTYYSYDHTTDSFIYVKP